MIRGWLAERKKRAAAGRADQIRNGECVCPGWDQGGGFEWDDECPQLREHFVGFGWRCWRCRECDGERWSRSVAPLTCELCGSTSGWHPAA